MKLPNYAKKVPVGLLMKFHCLKCKCSRWGRLNKPFTDAASVRKANLGEYRVTCLKCSNENTHNHNWYVERRP